jgi:hypothetical protein
MAQAQALALERYLPQSMIENNGPAKFEIISAHGKAYANNQWGSTVWRRTS